MSIIFFNQKLMLRKERSLISENDEIEIDVFIYVRKFDINYFS